MGLTSFRNALIALTLVLSACAIRGYQTPLANLAFITRTVVLPQVPSGSALVRQGKTLYIISDDAPYLFSYDLISGRVDSFWLPATNSRLHRIPWQTKPDYEAAILTKWQGSPCIFTFGSGSLSAHREWIGLYRLGKHQLQERYNTHLLYEHLRKATHIPEGEFNLEGAALTPDGNLLLFNRGRQELFRLRWTDFVAWLTNQQLPDVVVQPIPTGQSAYYTFSGAETIDENRVLFTASREATRYPWQDGVIMGSALGMLEKGPDAHWTVKKLWSVVDTSGKLATEKVESAIPEPGDKSGYRFIAITDNDDGQSKLLWIEVR